MSELKVSLCIPTMDRWYFLQKTLPKYLENPYIAEIIISDENGNDAKMIQRQYASPKLKVFVNGERLGGFKNKRMAVSKASYPWVCLADSDNFMPISYFKAAAKAFDPSNLNMIYSPSYTLPQTNHAGFDWRHMVGHIVNAENYKHYWKNYSGISALFNTGNYIVSTDLYLRSEHPNDGTDYDTSCRCLDALYQNYLIFNNGGSFMAVADMGYSHTFHPGSYYINEHTITNIQFFESLMK